eukprot:1151508-Pelagomonas_calceolata.AAC.2
MDTSYGKIRLRPSTSLQACTCTPCTSYQIRPQAVTTTNRSAIEHKNNPHSQLLEPGASNDPPDPH